MIKKESEFSAEQALKLIDKLEKKILKYKPSDIHLYISKWCQKQSKK